MSKKVLLLIMLSFSVATGGFWVLQAQDPQNPSNVRQDPPTASATTQTDLSGTYTGNFNCEPLGLMGETTLTITGNDFTTADGRSGRIVASTTDGYTAVVLQMGGAGGTGATGAAGTTGTTPMIVSMRGRKAGNRLILTPVSGTTMRCSFTPGRATARGRRNPRTQPPAATGTEVANPATPTESPSPAESPSPMPEQTPAPSPSPSPTPSPEPMPSPTPGEPMPSPTPGGSPVPTPSPSPGEPMPSPSPGSSPSPSPSPSPRW